MQGGSVMVFAAGRGLVRTEVTELQANTPAGQHWIPSTRESFESGDLRRPQEVAQRAIEMIGLATPALSGRSYGPDTDFSDWG